MNAVRSAGGGGGGGNSYKFENENAATPQPIVRPTCSISELMRKTKFSKEEIRHYYRSFKQDCPLGEVNKSHFAIIFSTLFPTGESFRYSSFLFQNIDRSNTGFIRFEDLIVTLSILIHGSIEDRLNWIFDLYDLDKDGILTRTELSQIITSVFQLIVPVRKPKLQAMINMIEERTDELFQSWNTRGDGRVHKEDFVRYCLQHETIPHSIEKFKSIL